jgi:hypothetical protein
MCLAAWCGWGPAGEETFVLDSMFVLTRGCPVQWGLGGWVASGHPLGIWGGRGVALVEVWRMSVGMEGCA